MIYHSHQGRNKYLLSEYPLRRYFLSDLIFHKPALQGKNLLMHQRDFLKRSITYRDFLMRWLYRNQDYFPVKFQVLLFHIQFP